MIKIIFNGSEEDDVILGFLLLTEITVTLWEYHTYQGIDYLHTESMPTIEDFLVEKVSFERDGKCLIEGRRHGFLSGTDGSPDVPRTKISLSRKNYRSQWKGNLVTGVCSRSDGEETKVVLDKVS
jgi:hypothetical protein